jgi:hypothetical protein
VEEEDSESASDESSDDESNNSEPGRHPELVSVENTAPPALDEGDTQQGGRDEGRSEGADGLECSGIGDGGGEGMDKGRSDGMDEEWSEGYNVDDPAWVPLVAGE